MASFSKGTTERDGLEAVMIRAETKRDAQAAIKLAKSWLKANGHRFKLVFFHEIIGTQWSNLGRSYSARIVYRAQAGIFAARSSPDAVVFRGPCVVAESAMSNRRGQGAISKGGCEHGDGNASGGGGCGSCGGGSPSLGRR